MGHLGEQDQLKCLVNQCQERQRLPNTFVRDHRPGLTFSLKYVHPAALDNINTTAQERGFFHVRPTKRAVTDLP